MSALLSIEGAELCQGDIANLLEFFNLGVRLMTLTWNYENEIGFPNNNLKENLNKDIVFSETKRG